MKLDKYYKTKLKLETYKFEKNYDTLNKVLYYFSFLGNIFLIYFGYFFVKSVTNSIPQLFPFQDTFFTIFVALFLTGYELTKRFTLEQLFTSIMQARKVTVSLVGGMIVGLLLVAGSFYLSVKGAHRLVDNTGMVKTAVDSTVAQRSDSIAKYYDKEIAYYRSQPANNRKDRLYRDSVVTSLVNAKDAKLQAVESKVQTKAIEELSTTKENDIAFLFITIFLELIILLGVGFHAYYIVGSYNETSKLLKLLKLYYQNGKKAVGDETLSFNKFKSLVDAQKIVCAQKDLKTFVILCQELDLVRVYKGKKREIAVSYEQAKELIENQEIV
jgi:hypothetical protein